MKRLSEALLCASIISLSACTSGFERDDEAPIAQEAALSSRRVITLDARDNGKELTLERGSRLRISLASPSADERWTVFLAPATLTEALAKYDRLERVKTFRWTVADDAPLTEVEKVLITPERRLDSGWEIDWKNVFYATLRYVASTAHPPSDVIVGNAEDGSVIRVRAGQDIVVRLPQQSAAESGWAVVERGGLGWAYWNRLSENSVEYRWETDHLPTGFMSGPVKLGYISPPSATNDALQPALQFTVTIEP
jgi:hypothetical protein